VHAEDVAIAETLLHDIPAEGGLLPYDQYAGKVLMRLKVTQRLRLAVLRRLKVTAGELTSSPASSYDTTVRWAEAAHDAGFTQDPSHARIFASPADQIWLIDRCAPLHVDVLLEPS